jgi:hypothetical protein
MLCATAGATAIAEQSWVHLVEDGTMSVAIPVYIDCMREEGKEGKNRGGERMSRGRLCEILLMS